MSLWQAIWNTRERWNRRLRLNHGWEVKLPCPQCGMIALPVVKGWDPNYAINFGARPTIFANVHCPRCDNDLKQAAGEKLVQLFADVSIPPQNQRWIISFVAFWIVWMALFCLGVMLLPRPAFVWVRGAMMGAAGISLILFRYGTQWLLHRCECGAPDYKFMGMLGRSYCLRCSTCGKLLRLRD